MACLSWSLWVYEWVHHQASSSFWLDQALKLELLWYISYIPLILSIFVPINLFLILPVLSMASIFFHTHNPLIPMSTCLLPIKSPFFSSPLHLHYFIPIHTINSSNTHPIHHVHFSTSCTFHTHFPTPPFSPFLSQFHPFSYLSSSRMNPYVPLSTIHSIFNSLAHRSSFSIIH